MLIWVLLLRYISIGNRDSDVIQFALANLNGG